MVGDDIDINDDPGHNIYHISNTKGEIVDFPREVETPHVQLPIYSSKSDKVVQVIALMDTGVASSILNPTVLPNDQRISHFKNFSTLSKEIFTTKLITKHPVVIEFFHVLQFRTKLFSSAVPPRINPDEMAEYPLEIFTLFGDRFDPSIMIERRTYYELHVFKKYGRSILKPFGVHLEYLYCHVFILLADDFPPRPPMVILDGMTDDPIPGRRPEPTNTIPKNVRTGFHTYTLDDVKVVAWPQRIQDFWDWLTAISVADMNFFLTSQDFSVNLNILLEVFCGDTGQRREKLHRQLFKMKCISFDRDIIDIHFQKMTRIYIELGGDSRLKQDFVSSLPQMLARHTMTII
ncbi:hypothetical protein MTR67_051972 [Solanum verrucosum]|uniref:Uncharacterized protein n=1 Tax=Solanum verrucosum TaxID=315347 RepID=A0AAF0V604_SOLVR|nr:hypothetical protein MTR67_051972 [Solanum verrucosum]